MKIKHLSSFADLLVYLVENEKLEAQDAINASTKGTVNGHLMLGALAYFIFGIDGADAVLKTLPLNFVRDAKILHDSVRNLLLWPVQLLDVAVLDLDILGYAPP
jgi:hypothetical protein